MMGAHDVHILQPVACDAPSAPMSADERLAYLRQFGDRCMGYSSLQPDMQYYHVPGMGYVPFMVQWGRPYVLGGPVCAAADRAELLAMFLRQHHSAAFAQIYEDDAVLLRDRFGFRTTKMGTETWIDIRKWNLEGGSKALLRRHRNNAIALGIKVREIDNDELNVRRSEIHALKTKWLGDRAGKQQYMRFLVRPEEERETLTRKFIGEMNGSQLVSYIVCDPLYAAGRTVGYYLDLTFYPPVIPYPDGERVFHGINYFTAMEIIRIVKDEGADWVTLGMSPLQDLQPTRGEHPMLRSMLEMLYEYGNSIYSFKGLARYKESYHADERPVYYASRANGFFDLIAMLRLSNSI